MEQSGAVHRRHRAADLDADGHDLRFAEAGALFEDLLERLALHELHPQADAIGDLLRTVDGDDVGMADAREQAAFSNG